MTYPLYIIKVQALRGYLLKARDDNRNSRAELGELVIMSNALEEKCSAQREQIVTLQQMVAAANEKLKMVELSSLEGQKTVVDLQCRLADAHLQNIKGEKFRKKLHNTILELKGNLRVFCRTL